MALTKNQRAELREMFGGRCAYCGCELPEKGWHADHIEPVRRETIVVRENGAFKGFKRFSILSSREANSMDSIRESQIENMRKKLKRADVLIRNAPNEILLLDACRYRGAILEQLRKLGADEQQQGGDHANNS